MKEKYKKLILPALVFSLFMPLVSMAANDEISLPERGERFPRDKKEFTGNFGRFEVDKADRAEKFLSKEGVKKNSEKGDMENREEKILENRAKHEEMMKILEAGDYGAWAEFVKDSDCPMASKITEENFSEFIENHKLRMENRDGGSIERNNNKQNNFKFKK